MSWVKSLVDLYDMQVNNIKNKIPPLYHDFKVVGKDDIVLEIDEEGNFINAANFEESKIIIPITEKSLKRTSGVCPQPLFDAVKYLNEKFWINNKKGNGFKMYIDVLENWCESEYSHPKVRAVLKYIKSNKILDDLNRLNIKYKRIILYVLKLLIIK